MQTKGIYRVSGNKADVEAVHQRFEEDQSKDFTELGFSVHAVTGALKSFFTKLPGALIPSDSYDGIIQATSKYLVNIFHYWWFLMISQIDVNLSFISYYHEKSYIVFYENFTTV